eukprot:3236199-Pyramimonas_sp.AAC.1
MPPSFGISFHLSSLALPEAMCGDLSGGHEGPVTYDATAVGAARTSIVGRGARSEVGRTTGRTAARGTSATSS